MNSGPTLELSLLGGLSISVDGEPSRFRYEKSRALLAYLALQGTPVSRRAVSELLWGDLPEKNALANLRVVLHDLNSELPGFLNISPTEVSLDTTASLSVDAELFVLLLEAAARPGTQNTAMLQIETVNAAIDLYAGAFLNGFHIANAPAFEEFVSTERSRFETLAVGAMTSLADHYSSEHQWGPAISVLTKLTQLIPSDEDARRSLMSALANSGDPEAALFEFGLLRTHLAEELGGSPTSETADLADEIAVAQRKPNSGLQFRVTEPPTPIIGRDGELAELTELTEADGGCFVTLTGPGGVGKTRLVHEIAIRRSKRSPGKVAVVHLAGVNAAKGVPDAIASALGITLAGLVSPSEELFAALRYSNSLLILDNLEQLLPDACELLDELRARCPSMGILATSRSRTRVEGEIVFPVEPLPIPDPGDNWRSLQASPAIELFLARARALGAAEELGDLASIARICAMFDGLPLAIELAAFRARLLTPSEIISSIDSVLDRLVASAGDLPERHQSLRLSISWSYELLGANARNILKYLGLFEGGIPLAALCGVSGLADQLVIEASHALVDSGLATRSRGSGGTRLHILDSTRAFAVELLEASSDASESALRFARAFLEFARTADSRLRGPGQSEWIARISDELNNLRAAIDIALRTEDVGLALGLANSLTWFCNLHGLIIEGREWLERALKLAAAHRAPYDDDGDLGRQIGNAHLGVILLGARLSEGESFDEELAAARASFREFGDQIGLAKCNYFQCYLWQNRRGDLSFADAIAAGQCILEAIPVFDSVGDRWSVARAGHSLSIVFLQLGDSATAENFARIAGRMFSDAGDRRSAAMCQSLLGIIHGLDGRLMSGNALLVEAFEEQRSIGDVVQSYNSLVALACNNAELGYGEESARLFGSADAMSERTGVRTARIFQPLVTSYRVKSQSLTDAATWKASYGAGFRSGIDIVLSVPPAARFHGTDNPIPANLTS